MGFPDGNLLCVDLPILIDSNAGQLPRTLDGNALVHHAVGWKRNTTTAFMPRPQWEVQEPF
jgi:hypothetical protein